MSKSSRFAQDHGGWSKTVDDLYSNINIDVQNVINDDSARQP